MTPTKTKQFGDKRINMVLDFLRARIGIDDFLQTKQTQRFMAKHIITLGEKIGRNEFADRLDKILEDPWKAQHANNLSFIYKQIKGYIDPSKIPLKRLPEVEPDIKKRYLPPKK